MKAIFLVSLVLVTYGVQTVLSDSENGSSLPDLTSNGWALVVCTVAVIIFGWLWCRFTDEPTVEIENKYYTVEVGQQAELRCSVLGAFPFIKSVTWEHTSPGGQPVQLDLDLPEYTRSKPDHLIINKTVKSDEGEYVCTVSSWYGKRRSTTTKLTLVEASTSSCVYKPATTAKYPSTKETTNYARICRLVVDVIPDVFRQLLIARLPVSGLTSVLINQRDQIFNLLNNQQKKIIYPRGGMFQGTAKDFDISLLYILLRNLGNIQPHRKGWGQVPDKADRSLSANIDRLRIQRNEAYGHAKSACLSDVDFQARWTDIRQSIKDLQNGGHITGKFVAAVNNIETMRMDPSTESNFIALVKEMEGEISDFKERQDKMTTDMDNLKGTVDVVSGDVGVARRDIDAVKKDVSDMKQTSSKTGGRDPKLTAMIDTTKSTIQTVKESYQFISTKSLKDAHQTLLENNIVVVQGNTGDGKSSIALELLHLLCCDEEGQQKQCRQPLQLHNIKDLDLVAPKSQLVIHFDDILGKNVVCHEEVKEWEKREKEIIAKLCGNEREANYLVITIRSGILNSLNGFEKLFTKQNIIDLRQYKDKHEKLELLRLYEPKDFKWKNDEETQIVSSAPDIGFPQCCRLFRDTPSLQTQRVKFFERPFHYFKMSLSKLEDGKFYGLLYLFLNGGLVMEHDLDPSIENIDESEKMKAAFAFDVVKVNPTPEFVHQTTRKAEFVKESLECLLGWLVKKESTQDSAHREIFGEHFPFGNYYPCYKFNHDSIEETVALLYGEKTPIGYIQNCPRKFLSYVTTTKNTPNRIVISSDSQTNAMYKRTVTEFKSVVFQRYMYFSECEYLATLDVWTHILFLQGFIRWLNGQNDDQNLCHLIKCQLLNGACSTGSEDRVSYLLSVGVTPDKETLFNVVKGGSVQLLRQLLKYDVIPTARARESRSSRNADNINVLHEACLFERKEMVTILCDTYPDLVHDTDYKGRSTLHLVAQTGNYDIFQTVERIVLKTLCKVEDVQHKCESEDGRVVHRSCVCGQYISQLVDKSGWTVLHVSCLCGHKELSLELCKSFPALITAVDNQSMTVLHWSCMVGRKELSLELCKYFPTLTTTVDSWGKTVLHYSCSGGHSELSLYLCKSFPALITAVGNDRRTVLHYSCMRGHRELSLELCRLYPALTTAVDNLGYHCLHHIAWGTTDVDWFTDCERHVKQYLETTGGKYDITTLLSNDGNSVLDLAKEWRKYTRNPLYDHLVQVFTK
ncbi:uncharacterized protein LOC117317979 [Pecten maximus]|uniref:uncharacterized protein LOC117317979 n=1 Tax=Pecten maximus TaxID=6579 RepID=UPI001458EB94|nr:uncharacterized protein LOC117317979 [Pecten maximus]